MPIHDRLVIDSLVLGSTLMTNTKTQTANFDCLDADYATLRVSLGSEINTNAVGPTLSLLSSDDTVVSNFATIIADKTAVAIVGATVVTYGVDMRSQKRYLRLSVTTATATNDDVTVAAIGTLSRNRVNPAGAGTDAGPNVNYI